MTHPWKARQPRRSTLAPPMNDQHTRSYTVLGLPPGSSWDEIRDAYKNLIKKWHPDRYPQDGQEQRIAEERSMEITRAYKTLADYYRQHGATPAKSSPIRVSNTTAGEPATGTDCRSARPTDPTATDTSYTQSRDRADTHSAGESTLWKGIAILIAMAMLAIYWALGNPSDMDQYTSAKPSPLGQESTSSLPADEKSTHLADKVFTVGSKLGEVYTIQGIPTKTEDGVWHYGKSRVFFVNGSVSRWDSQPENPLHASLDIAPVSTEQDFIHKGSTKTEVQAIQGTPWRQTEREWTYGSSRIFFSGDMVTGWQESALSPLKIRR